MELVLWVLLITLPHEDPAIVGAAPSEEVCKQTMATLQDALEEKHATAKCVAYVPRDSK